MQRCNSGQSWSLLTLGKPFAQHRRYHLVVSISVLSVVQSRKYKVQRPRRCIKHHLWRLGPLRLWQSDIMRPAQKYVSNCLTTATTVVHAKMQFWSILVFVDAWETLAQHGLYHLWSVVQSCLWYKVESTKYKASTMNQAPLVSTGTLAALARQHYAACTKGFKIIQLSLSIQVSTFCCVIKCQKQIKSTEADCRSTYAVS